MPPKRGKKNPRLHYLIPEGQDCSSQQFYITPAAAHGGASASVVPPRPSTDSLHATSVSDDRRRIFRVSVPIQSTANALSSGDVLHTHMDEDLPDLAAPADYFNVQEDAPEDPDATADAGDDVTRQLEVSVRAFLLFVPRSGDLTRRVPIGRSHGKLAYTP